VNKILTSDDKETIQSSQVYTVLYIQNEQNKFQSAIQHTSLVIRSMNN